MPKHEVSVVIKRPVEEVFAFVENPKNEPIWRHSMREVEVETAGGAKADVVAGSDGGIVPGATGRESGKSLGRSFESTWEITEYEPNHRVAFRSTSGPAEYEGVWSYESVDGGTRLTITTRWEIVDRESFGKMSDRVWDKLYRKSLDGDLQTLKRLLEA